MICFFYLINFSRFVMGKAADSWEAKDFGGGEFNTSVRMRFSIDFINLMVYF